MSFAVPSGGLHGGANVLPATGFVQQTVDAGAIRDAVDIVLPTGRVFKLKSITNTPPDDQVCVGYSPKEGIPYSSVNFEGAFDTFGNGGTCFESYLEDAGAAAAGIMRGWFTAFLYDATGGGTVGDAVTVIESGNSKGISFQDVVGGVGTAFFGGTPVSIGLFSLNVNLGAAATTNVVNQFAQSGIQRFLGVGSVLIDQTYSLGGTVYVTDIGTTPTLYGIRMNAAGQALFLQTLLGTLGLFSDAGSLLTGGGGATLLRWGSAGLGLNGHAQAAASTVADATGGVVAASLVDVTTLGLADPVKINANFATLLAAIKAQGAVL